MSSDSFKVLNNDMLKELDNMQENSIDSIITDPPYELNFMGKGWDNAGVSFQKETWEKCLRVLKPGGYLLAFGGSRTFHRIAVAIEDAGFEIRDTIMWLYGSGFPKSMNIGLALDKKLGVESEVVGQNQQILEKQANDLRTGHRKILDSLNAGAEERNNGFSNVSADILKPTSDIGKQWEGWGTSLKPSYEPIIVARKPFESSLIENIMEHGVGALNIDDCRVPFEDTPNPATNPLYRTQQGYKIPEKGRVSQGAVPFSSTKNEVNEKGRFPSNVILTYDETDVDEVCGGMPNTKSVQGVGVRRNVRTAGNVFDNSNCGFKNEVYDENKVEGFNDSGSASRYFYCAKASKEDRDSGLEDFETKVKVFNGKSDKPSKEMKDVESRFTTECRNTHPTVKPTRLMQYLIRLVSPKGATVLDPFMGSGSTGKASMQENLENGSEYKFIGIELSEEYCKIANARIESVCRQMRNRLF